jgi:CRISPR/Cas system-associated endonuclease/helicase Cas3
LATLAKSSGPILIARRKLNEYGLAEHALKTLQKYIDKKSQQNSSSTKLHVIRQQLLKNCLQKAQKETGCFTLTAPTGSGKTLSMLSFALQHALENNLQRIILIIPYLSIIEQTAKTYREVFADFNEDLILEHHSMADLGKESAETDADGKDEKSQYIKRQRLLSENWDAPIVITTSVQFLESLFSNRPSSCRKIHRIANAVVLFDEVQTLPTSLAI